MAKRFSLASIMMLLVMILAFTGCHKGEVRVDAIDGLTTDVCDRHDKMVKGELDPKSWSEADKATYLRSTAILRKVLAEAKK